MRWRIENKTFSTLKIKATSFKAQLGHGRKHLATVFVALMLLEFGMGRRAGAALALRPWLFGERHRRPRQSGKAGECALSATKPPSPAAQPAGNPAPLAEVADKTSACAA